MCFNIYFIACKHAAVHCRYDALDSSHAVAQNASAVTSEAEAETTFTRIAYEKGASVLRMLHAHMLRAVKDSGGDVDTEPWLLRRSRKVLEASGQSNSGIFFCCQKFLL